MKIYLDGNKSGQNENGQEEKNIHTTVGWSLTRSSDIFKLQDQQPASWSRSAWRIYLLWTELESIECEMRFWRVLLENIANCDCSPVPGFRTTSNFGAGTASKSVPRNIERGQSPERRGKARSRDESGSDAGASTEPVWAPVRSVASYRVLFFCQHCIFVMSYH